MCAFYRVIGKYYKKKFMFHLFFFCFLFMSFQIFVILNHSYVAAKVEDSDMRIFEAEGVRIQVKYGYKKIVRLGRESVCYIDIYALSRNIIGSAGITIYDDEGKPTTYSYEVNVYRGEICQVEIPFMVINDMDSIKFQLIDRSKVIIDTNLYVNIKTNTDKTFIGILSDYPERLEYLKNSDNYIISLDLESFRSPKDLDIFDVIVIDNYDTGTIEEDIFQSILEWAKSGGTIVIGTGVRYKATFSKFIEEDVFEVTIRKLYYKATLFGLDETEIMMLRKQMEEEYANADTYDTEPKKQNLLRFQVESAKPLVEEEFVLLEEMDYGLGNFLFFHIELGTAQLKGNIITIEILDQIMDHLSEQRYVQLQDTLNSQNISDNQYETLLASNNGNVPNVKKYMIVILLYIVIIGPVVYYLLCNKDRNALIYIIIPVFALGCTLILYRLGNETRFDEMIGNYFNVLYVQESDIIEETSLSLTVASKKVYDLKFSNRINVLAINDETYGYKTSTSSNDLIYEGSCSLSYQENSLHMELSNYPSFTSLYYVANNQYAYDGDYNCTVEFTFDGFSGNFENHLGIDLKNCMLITETNVVYLGDVKNDGAYTFCNEEGVPIFTRSKTMVPARLRNLIAKNASGKIESDEKVAALNYFIQKIFGVNGACYLVGFSNHSYEESISTEFTQQVSAKGCNLVVLPISVNYEKNSIIYEPTLDTSYELLEGNSELGSGYRILTGTTVIKYSLPEDDKVTGLYYFDFLNSEFDNHQNGFSGYIFFYNNTTEEYDLVFANNNKLITNVREYISEDNEIIVKFQQMRQYNGYTMTIPYITYLKEVS